MQIALPTPPYRTGSHIEQRKVALVYNCGGIGDYIQWTTAMDYAITSNPHIYGYIVSPEYFADLARLWHKKHEPRFTVLVERDFSAAALIESHPLHGIPLVAPHQNDHANACNHHLFELGWIYYVQKKEIPEGWARTPEIFGSEADISRFNLPSRYAVITTTATADNRRLSGEAVNLLAAYLITQGLTPIFLGKRDLASGYWAVVDEGIDFSLGQDLREKTTLVEAACIMSGAELTIGCDNGLLHLASCTKAPVVWVFTSVHPKYRLPPRDPKLETLVLTPSERLECRFCNTRMNYLIGHDFKNCLYGDLLCIKELTGAVLIKGAEKILKK